MNKPLIKIITTFQEFSAFELEWNKLFNSIEQPTIFISHSWLSIWWRNFGNQKPLIILTVWDRKYLIGALPLFQTTISIFKLFNFKCLHSLTNPHSPMYNIISRSENLNRVINSIKDYLVKNSSLWDILLLERLDETFKSPERFKSIFNDGKTRFQSKPWEGSYYIRFIGTFEEYLSRMNKSSKRNLLNKNNRIKKKGIVDFRAVKEYNQDEINNFLSIENTGWKNENGSAIKLSKDVSKFYREVAEIFSKTNRFLLFILYVDETAIAANYGLIDNNRFYQLKIGVNYSYPEVKKLSPGQAIMMRMTRYCFENNLRGFDFCAPFYPYEELWTREKSQKYIVTIYNLQIIKVRLYLLLRNIFKCLKKFKFNKAIVL